MRTDLKENNLVHICQTNTNQTSQSTASELCKNISPHLQTSLPPIPLEASTPSGMTGLLNATILC